MNSDPDALRPRRSVPVERAPDASAAGGHAPADAPRNTAPLGRGDSAARATALSRMQQQHGNAYVQRVVQTQIQRRRAVQRDDAELLDAPAAPASPAQETVGPVAESTYKVDASSLADAAAEIEARDEAAAVNYEPKMKYSQVDGKVTEVTITVEITMEMPSWKPPASVGPKAKAEWNRAFSALRAHEDGHVALVHKRFDGLAKQILGKPTAKADQLFAAAKAGLDTDTKAYDKKTDHGRKTGTVIDVSIEDAEKKEIEEAKAKAKASEKK